MNNKIEVLKDALIASNKFYGLEKQTSQLIEAIEPWFLFGHKIKSKAMNYALLAGPPGVGKSLLARVIATKLVDENRVMTLSLGDEMANSFCLASDIAEFVQHNEGEPCFLILEELQNSMSMHHQVGTSLSQIFEGKLTSGSLIRDKIVQELIQLHLELSELRDVIKVNKGAIVEGKDIYEEVLETAGLSVTSRIRFLKDMENEEVSIIPNGYLDDIITIIRNTSLPLGSMQGIKTISQLYRAICEMDFHQYLGFLEHVIRAAKNQNHISLNNLFIIGTLNSECFRTEEFSEYTSSEFFTNLEFSSEGVRADLSKIFSDAMLSRLSSNIVIFPYLNRDQGKKIVVNRFLEFTSLAFAHKIRSKLDDTLIDFLLDQNIWKYGARPLIYESETLFTRLLSKLISQNIKVDEPILWCYVHGMVKLITKSGNEVLAVPAYQTPKTQSRQTQNKLVLASFHIAGKVLTHFILKKQPISVRLKYHGSNYHGHFSQPLIDEDDNQGLFDSLIIQSSGITSEELVFGITTSISSSDDSYVCHELASKYAETFSNWHNQFPFSSDLFEIIKMNREKQILRLIEEARSVSDKIIRQHEKTLFEIANHLKSNLSITSEQLQFISQLK